MSKKMFRLVLVLVLVSLALEIFDGLYLVRFLAWGKVKEYETAVRLLCDITYAIEYFWKFGLPILVGSLFKKTRKYSWLVWLVFMARFALDLSYSYIGRDIFNLLSGIANFGVTTLWLCYGGYLVKKIGKGKGGKIWKKIQKKIVK